ncbi:MAG: PF20097 family protein [Luteolibacter sp.]
MSDPIRLCPKCNDIMQIGFIPDFSYGATLETKWFYGEAKKGFFGGVKGASPLGGIPVHAYRCAGCGFLEFFAVPRPA